MPINVKHNFHSSAQLGNEMGHSDMIRKQVYNRKTNKKSSHWLNFTRQKKWKLKTLPQFIWAGWKKILINCLQYWIPTCIKQQKPTLKFPSLVPTKSHTTYTQQKDQNRHWGGGFQYSRCSPHLHQASWISLGMYGTEVGIFQKPNQIYLCSFLQTQNGMDLEAQVIFPLQGLSHGLTMRRGISR